MPPSLTGRAGVEGADGHAAHGLAVAGPLDPTGALDQGQGRRLDRLVAQEGGGRGSGRGRLLVAGSIGFGIAGQIDQPHAHFVFTAKAQAGQTARLGEGVDLQRQAGGQGIGGAAGRIVLVDPQARFRRAEAPAAPAEQALVHLDDIGVGPVGRAAGRDTGHALGRRPFVRGQLVGRAEGPRSGLVEKGVAPMPRAQGAPNRVDIVAHVDAIALDRVVGEQQRRARGVEDVGARELGGQGLVTAGIGQHQADGAQAGRAHLGGVVLGRLGVVVEVDIDVAQHRVIELAELQARAIDVHLH